MASNTTKHTTDAKSFREIFLANWVPALLTALIGGLVVAYLAPVIQTQFANSAALKKRQLELWESIGENFTNYIVWRSRLNSVARAEISYGPTDKVPKELLDNKARYLLERDKYRNLFRRDLLLAPYYFTDPQVKTQIDEFQKWHTQFATATVDKLPDDAEYLKWRDRLMETIRKTSLSP